MRVVNCFREDRVVDRMVEKCSQVLCGFISQEHRSIDIQEHSSTG